MKYTVLSFLFAASACLFAQTVHAQLIIANPNIKASDASRSDIKDIFSGGSSSLGGTHATPVLLKAGPVTDEFLSTFVGKSDAAFRASWRSLLFSGQATMPKSFDTDAAVVAFVAQTPGAIGYIAKGSPHEGVKVIAAK